MRPRLILSVLALSVAVALVGMWATAAPAGSPEDAKENELRAIGCVRSLNTAASVYREQHPDKGFPNSLADLGWRRPQAATPYGRTAVRPYTPNFIPGAPPSRRWF